MDTGRFHVTFGGDSENVMCDHLANEDSISRNMKNEPATTRFPGPIGPSSARGSGDNFSSTH